MRSLEPGEAMQVTDREKWRVRASVLGIFLLGFVAGALALNLYRSNRGLSAGSGNPRRGGGFERLLDDLNLTPDQKAKVDQIFSDTRKQFMEMRKGNEPKYIEIRKQTEEKLKAVLTPDQWNRFQQTMKQRREQHRQWHDGHGPYPGPGSPEGGPPLGPPPPGDAPPQ